MLQLIRPHKQVRVDYGREFHHRDFIFDAKLKNWTIGTVPDKVDYTLLACAAAEGCDSVRLMKIFKETGDYQQALGVLTPPEQAGDYYDMSQVADSFEEAQKQISDANRAAAAAFEELPEDFRKSYTLEELVTALSKDPDMLNKYVAFKASSEKKEEPAALKAAAPKTEDSK